MAAAGEAKEKTRGWQVLHSTVGSELLQPSGSGRFFFFSKDPAGFAMPQPNARTEHVHGRPASGETSRRDGRIDESSPRAVVFRRMETVAEGGVSIG